MIDTTFDRRRGRIARRPRRGYTLIEFMLATLLVGVLIGLLLPAVNAAREAARRSRCARQLQNLIIGVHHYELQQGRLPSGVINPAGPIRQAPAGYHHNWISALLPYLEEQRLYEQIDFSAGVYDPPNLAVRQRSIPLLICSSQAKVSATGPYSCYAANYHHAPAPIDVNNTGVFFLNSRLRQDDILDGFSNTIYLMEKGIDPLDFGWMSGTHATLRTAVDMVRTGDAPPRQPLPGMPQFRAPRDLRLKEGAFPVDYQFISGSSVNALANIPPLAITSSAGSPHPGATPFAYGDGRVGYMVRGTAATLPELCHRQDGRMPSTKDQ